MILYTTVTAGTTITAAWGNNVRDGIISGFASAAARTSARSSPIEGMVSYRQDGPTLELYNGSFDIPLQPSSAVVNATETTTSTAYTDITTVGPSVTLVTGTSAICALSAGMRHSGADIAYMGVAISGASSIAANDNQAAEVVGTSTITGALIFKLTGLTAGSNTFKARYRTPSGTATFQSRNITVWALP